MNSSGTEDLCENRNRAIDSLLFALVMEKENSSTKQRETSPTTEGDTSEACAPVIPSYDYKQILVTLLSRTKKWLSLQKIVAVARRMELVPIGSKCDGTEVKSKLEQKFASVLYNDMYKDKSRVFACRPDKEVFGLSSWLQEPTILIEGRNCEKPNELACVKVEHKAEESGGKKRKAGVRKKSEISSSTAGHATSLPPKKIRHSRFVERPVTVELKPTVLQRIEPVTKPAKAPSSSGSKKTETREKATDPSGVEKDIMADIQKIQGIASKLGDNNLVVGKLWLDLSLKLKPIDSVLADYSGVRAAEILIRYKHQKLESHQRLVDQIIAIDKKQRLIKEALEWQVLNVCGMSQSSLLGQKQKLVGVANALNSIQQSQTITAEKTAEAIQAATVFQATMREVNAMNSYSQRNAVSMQSALVQAKAQSDLLGMLNKLQKNTYTNKDISHRKQEVLAKNGKTYQLGNAFAVSNMLQLLMHKMETRNAANVAFS